MREIDRFEKSKGPLHVHDLVGVKWDELFHSEYELIQALRSIHDIPKLKRKYRGYEYILLFKHYTEKGWTLSPKQMTQLKRVAGELYRYLYNTKKFGEMH